MIGDDGVPDGGADEVPDDGATDGGATSGAEGVRNDAGDDEESDWLPAALVLAGIGALCCLGLPVVGGAAVTGGVAVGGLVGNVVAGLATAVTLGVVLVAGRYWARRG